MGLAFTTSGSTSRTQRFLQAMQKPSLLDVLDHYGQAGVTALASATPKDTMLTANSWTYEVEIGQNESKITWLNTNSYTGANVAILLQYGHGTGTGGYVSGIDYINPAIKPIFDEIANAVWKKVTSA